MRFIADLHVHSRFSRATSASLDFAALHRSAKEKGIGLVATGDFTHPGWMAEIEEQLEPAEQGLFRLKRELVKEAEQGLAAACGGQVRFILQVEISNIYKKCDRVRKNHNLVFVPTLEAARSLAEKLGSIGNISSDGRPILGLDARDLLEITLENDPLSFLIPAHIWTPWFSMLGSKSGFDSIGECFGDLAGHIFAAETGLSSDPLMNWRVSGLDRINLISNSDAHSAAKLGREANVFDLDWSYETVLRALKTGEGFLGTIEFFPEEGKYHVDGHRKCQVRLEPEETRKLGGKCPVCGGNLTVGVMSRVDGLADRPAGVRPPKAREFVRLVPLAEVAGEVLGFGPQAKKTEALVSGMLRELGPELSILNDLPLEEINGVAGGLMAEAIGRVRQGRVAIDAGYDGEFGKVRIFAPGEKDGLSGQMAFFAPAHRKPNRADKARDRGEKKRGFSGPDKDKRSSRGPAFELNSPGDPLAGLDADQMSAATTLTGPLLVVAGPGTGKTRTLVSRIANLIRSNLARPQEALAIAFTKQAAAELEERIARIVPWAGVKRPLVTTFHGLGLSILREIAKTDPRIVDDKERRELVERACSTMGTGRNAKDLLVRISLAKQSAEPLSAIGDDSELADVYAGYERLLAEQEFMDIDDLVLKAYLLLAGDGTSAAEIADRYKSISIDEYQDVNDVQAALVRLLSPDGEKLMAIGDPHQSIYGFRGAKPGHFARFEQVFTGAKSVSLRTTYRLTENLLRTAEAVIGVAGEGGLQARERGLPVEIVACPSPASEAEQIVVRLERLMGGTSYFAIDSGRGREGQEMEIGFGDVAVLSRTKTQRREIIAALEQSSIPCHSVGEDEPHDPRSQKIAVMTMHASKGREFEAVFITGVEPGLVPLDIEGFSTDPDEERRLLYVAITRAKKLAVLSHSARRTLFGKRLAGGPSPFLAGLPESAVVRSAPTLRPKKPSSTQLSLF